MFLKEVSCAHQDYILFDQKYCEILYFSSHYSSLQCHMVIQKCLWYIDLLLKKRYLSLSMLKTFFHGSH